MADPTLVRTRFAPSPSGHLHVGGARTALFCWAWAKGKGGKFVLRIEDTDVKRSSDAASMAFMEDLAWLGIDWDEGPEHEGRGGGEFGPYFQSQRLDHYDRCVDRLIAEGKAYRAFDTSEELEEKRRLARERKQTYRYDHAATAVDPATADAWLAEGRPHVVRFRLPNEDPVLIDDQVLGCVTVNPEQVDDFVIRKADGYPTYHFAVVVDDEMMGVTDVIRAQEHLNNTAKHILLQDALGFRRPAYAHIPLITNPDGSKMSKRDKDKALRAVVRERKIDAPPSGTVDEERWSWWLSDKKHQLEMDEAARLGASLDVVLPEINVDDFRQAGYLPEVLVNYLALLGWNPGGDVERFDREFLVAQFSLDRVGKSAAKFDRDKLLAFNNDTLSTMSPDDFVALLRGHCERYHPEFIERLDAERFALFARTNQARAKTLEDPVRGCRFVVIDDDALVYEDSKNVRKALGGESPNGFDHLTALRPILASLEEWTVESTEAAVKRYAEEHAQGNLGRVAQPLRIAVSGTTVSPAIFDTLVILGKNSAVRRIERCLDMRERLS